MTVVVPHKDLNFKYLRGNATAPGILGHKVNKSYVLFIIIWDILSIYLSYLIASPMV